MDLGEQAHQDQVHDPATAVRTYTAHSTRSSPIAGIQTVLCNVPTPRMNAIAERWIGGCRRELPDRTLVWNQAHLRRILHAYEIHDNQLPGRTGRWPQLRH
jgi:hypothetical protein